MALRKMVCAAFLAVGSTATMAVISAALQEHAQPRPQATRALRHCGNFTKGGVVMGILCGMG